MFNTLFRIVAFCIGIVLILEAGLPTFNVPEQVDRHTSSNNNNGDTSYNLYFVGGRIDSCSVGYAAYTRLKDGDSVTVSATRIFPSCVRITDGEEIIYSKKYWRWLTALSGLFALAIALGWVKSDESDPDD